MALFHEDRHDMKAFDNAYSPGMVAFMQQDMNGYAQRNLRCLKGSASGTMAFDTCHGPWPMAGDERMVGERHIDSRRC